MRGVRRKVETDVYVFEGEEEGRTRSSEGNVVLDTVLATRRDEGREGETEVNCLISHNACGKKSQRSR